MVNKRVIDKIRQYIMIIPKDFGVKKAYLFGSFAKGEDFMFKSRYSFLAC